MASENSISADSNSRSPLLMNPFDTAVVIVDVQEKLLPHISNGPSILWNITRIIRGAEALGVAVLLTEQYPEGLGPTDSNITNSVRASSEISTCEKRMFSCRECRQLTSYLSQNQIKNVLVVGIETHVCVMQSALDLMAGGFEVYIAVDAVGSRFEIDHQTAFRRMELSGATLVTTEMALFEWCESAEAAGFKQISGIVREPFEESSS